MAMLELDMSDGEQIRAEAGAMVYMRGDFEVKTRTRQGGVFKKIKVAALGGEWFFVNDFIAHGDCALGLTGPPIGDIAYLDVEPSRGYIVQTGAYIASSEDVDLDTKWQGFTKGLFGSEFFMLKVSGHGGLFLNAYEGIVEKHLGDGERMIVDNYHLVALTDDIRYKVIKVAGIKTTILGGEGLATELIGPGTVYFQTKNLREFVDFLGLDQKREALTSGAGRSAAGTVAGIAIKGLLR